MINLKFIFVKLLDLLLRIQDQKLILCLHWSNSLICSNLYYLTWCSAWKQILGIQFIQHSPVMSRRLILSYDSSALISPSIMICEFPLPFFPSFRPSITFFTRLSTLKQGCSYEHHRVQWCKNLQKSFFFETRCTKFLSFNIGIQLKFSILHHVHISKAYNLSLSYHHIL